MTNDLMDQSEYCLDYRDWSMAISPLNNIIFNVTAAFTTDSYIVARVYGKEYREDAFVSCEEPRSMVASELATHCCVYWQKNQ